MSTEPYPGCHTRRPVTWPHFFPLATSSGKTSETKDYWPWRCARTRNRGNAWLTSHCARRFGCQVEGRWKKKEVCELRSTTAGVLGSKTEGSKIRRGRSFVSRWATEAHTKRQNRHDYTLLARTTLSVSCLSLSLYIFTLANTSPLCATEKITYWHLRLLRRWLVETVSPVRVEKFSRMKPITAESPPCT